LSVGANSGTSNPVRILWGRSNEKVGGARRGEAWIPGEERAITHHSTQMKEWLKAAKELGDAPAKKQKRMKSQFLNLEAGWKKGKRNAYECSPYFMGRRGDVVVNRTGFKKSKENPGLVSASLHRGARKKKKDEKKYSQGGRVQQKGKKKQSLTLSVRQKKRGVRRSHRQKKK